MRRLLLMVFLTFAFLPCGSLAAGVGDEAPGFTASSTHGELALEGYRGQKSVILAFYYKDFTGG